jgi:hypothetical protein
MKLTLCLALMMAIVSMACRKDSKKQNEDPSGITGFNWQLVANFNDPGNGSGTWQNYTGPYLFLRLNSNGRVQADNGTFPSSFNTYSILSDSTISFTNALTGASSEFMYAHTTGELILWGPCREACGQKFARVYAID